MSNCADSPLLAWLMGNATAIAGQHEKTLLKASLDSYKRSRDKVFGYVDFDAELTIDGAKARLDLTEWIGIDFNYVITLAFENGVKVTDSLFVTSEDEKRHFRFEIEIPQKLPKSTAHSLEGKDIGEIIEFPCMFRPVTDIYRIAWIDELTKSSSIRMELKQ